MDILVRLTVPNFIYKFYHKASKHIAGSSAEEVMADALAAYAGLISDEIAKELERSMPDTAERSD